MRRIRKVIQKKHNFKFSIPIRSEMEILVEHGDVVKKGDSIIRSNSKRIIESYHLPTELGIRNGSENEHISRLSGEFVSQGEVLAEKVTTAGLGVKKVLATKEGVLSTARLESGYLDILSENVEVELKADVHGDVVSADSRKGLEILTSVWALDIFTKSHGKQEERKQFGEFKMIKDGSSVYTIKDLDDSYYGKIVFAGRFVYPDIVRELYERGAELVIVYAINYIDLRELELPVAVIGGFGQLGFPSKILDFLRAMSGKLVVVDHMEREMLFGDGGEYQAVDDGEKRFHFTEDFGVGTSLIILDIDNFGRVGKVSSIEEDGYLHIEFEGGGNALLSSESVQPISY
jgi:hypothetical protein